MSDTARFRAHIEMTRAVCEQTILKMRDDMKALHADLPEEEQTLQAIWMAMAMFIAFDLMTDAFQEQKPDWQEKLDEATGWKPGDPLHFTYEGQA